MANNPLANHLMWKTVLAIMVVTLFPFDIVVPSVGLPAMLERFWQRPIEWDDFILNMVMFLPVGLLLRLLLPERRHLWLIVAVGAGFSLVLEMVQLMIPQRMSALPDVISNAAGTLIGAGLGRRWGRYSVDAFYRLLGRVRHAPYALALIVAALCYFSGWMLYAAHLIRETRLDNWDASYHLCIANEMNGKRGWRGSVARIAFFDQALSEAEAVRMTTEENISATPVAAADFSLAGWNSAPQGLPAWRLMSADNIRQTGEGIDFRGGWLKSEAPPEQLMRRLVGQNRFSIFVRFRTSDITLSGPVRILTWSRNFYHHNFMLGQHQRGLMFNLNTMVTSHRGNSPYILLPDVLRENEWQNLVVTYNGNTVRLFLDGKAQAFPLRLSPAAAVFAPLKYFPSYSLPMLQQLFLALVFFPVGVMMGMAKPGSRNTVFIGLSAAAAACVLQGIQVTMANRNIDPGEWAVSVVLMLTGALFCRFPSPAEKGEVNAA